MKVKDLIKKLKALDGELVVVIDYDPENGWYNLENIKVVSDTEFEEDFVNLISSNEM